MGCVFKAPVQGQRLYACNAQAGATIKYLDKKLPLVCLAD